MLILTSGRKKKKKHPTKSTNHKKIDFYYNQKKTKKKTEKWNLYRYLLVGLSGWFPFVVFVEEAVFYGNKR